MGKGKGKARASPKGGTRKIAPLHASAAKVKLSKLSASTSIVSMPVIAAASPAVPAVGGGSSKKSASSRKPRLSDKNDTSSASTSTGGAQGHRATGVAKELPSLSTELFKLTCTCPHLAQHPDRQQLLRRLIDMRTEVRCYHGLTVRYNLVEKL